MAAQSPQAWRDLEAAAELLTPNKTALAACRDTAAKMKKEQHCIVVSRRRDQSHIFDGMPWRVGRDYANLSIMCSCSVHEFAAGGF